MTARRILGGIALLLATVTTAACAQSIAGTGTIASDVQAGGGGVTGSSGPTSSPSSGGGSTETGSSTPTPSSSSSSGGGASPVCDALNKETVESAFGTGVSFSRSQSSGCSIRATDGRSMIVAVFDYLTLAEYKKPGNTDLTVGGHPATRSPSTIIYVGRSTDPSAAGLLAAYFSGLGDNGDAIAVKVLEQLVPKFKK